MNGVRSDEPALIMGNVSIPTSKRFLVAVIVTCVVFGSIVFSASELTGGESAPDIGPKIFFPPGYRSGDFTTFTYPMAVDDTVDLSPTLLYNYESFPVRIVSLSPWKPSKGLIFLGQHTYPYCVFSAVPVNVLWQPKSEQTPYSGKVSESDKIIEPDKYYFSHRSKHNPPAFCHETVPQDRTLWVDEFKVSKPGKYKVSGFIVTYVALGQRRLVRIPIHFVLQVYPVAAYKGLPYH